MLKRGKVPTSSISAALFKSRMPSSASLSRSMNFLVNTAKVISHKKLSVKPFDV
jgi:hypothetical protein